MSKFLKTTRNATIETVKGYFAMKTCSCPTPDEVIRASAQPPGPDEQIDGLPDWRRHGLYEANQTITRLMAENEALKKERDREIAHARNSMENASIDRAMRLTAEAKLSTATSALREAREHLSAVVNRPQAAFDILTRALAAINETKEG